MDAIPKMKEWSLRFQGKPLDITVNQIYALTGNAEEAEVEWFFEDLQDLLELNKTDLHDPDNHDGVITHLEQDIPECNPYQNTQNILHIT